MGNFAVATSNTLARVHTYGNYNFADENYNFSDVFTFGSFTTTKNGAIYPTSLSNACFINSLGVKLTSAVAISNVFSIATQQPITKSNQGIIVQDRRQL
jgi:hypothetical protein